MEDALRTTEYRELIGRVASKDQAARDELLRRFARKLERLTHKLLSGGMAFHRAAARRRRGELLGGETGRGMTVALDTDLVERGIQKPAQFAAMYAPGFRNDWSICRSTRVG